VYFTRLEKNLKSAKKARTKSIGRKTLAKRWILDGKTQFNRRIMDFAGMYTGKRCNDCIGTPGDQCYIVFKIFNCFDKSDVQVLLKNWAIC
jgi:hypothetical protein